MTTLPDIERADQISRQRWAHVMGEVLMKLPHEVRCQMVAQGEDEFIRLAHHELAGHEFHQADYQAMFRRLREGTFAAALAMTPFRG